VKKNNPREARPLFLYAVEATRSTEEEKKIKD